MVMITVVAAFMITMNFLASAEIFGHGDRIRRERGAGKDVHVVARDEFLREPGGDVRRDAAGVLANDLDLLAGDGIALLLHVELDAVVHLRGKIGELPGIGHDHPDLHRSLSQSC